MCGNTDELTDAVMSVADWMAAHGVQHTGELSQHIDAIKTIGYYGRALDKAVVDFYGNKLEAGQFIDKMITLIDGQLTRAWNEGMRNVGLDPLRDMLPIHEQQLRGIVNGEYDRVLDFAQAIEDARKAGLPVKPLLDRTELWVNRYTQVVNEAQVSTRPNEVFEWQYGDTKRHCSTCLALHGTVATGAMWAASGVKPQSPPNPRLECGGWRCRCRLVKTDKPISENGVWVLELDRVGH